MNPDSAILHTVMRRVRIVYLVRATAPMILAAGLFLVALWGIGREVWVAKVFQNMPSVWNVPEVLSFISGAFLYTEFVVQVLSIIALGALVWLARTLALRMRTWSFSHA